MAGRPLLLIGSGGFGREVAQAVLGCPDGPWRLAGFLDDDDDRWGCVVGGVPVLGPSSLVHERADDQVLVCTGRPDDYASRARIVERLDLPEERFATFVHPASTVSPSSTLGPGSAVLAGSVLTADVHVGAHVAVMPGVVLTHDDVVGAFATLASRVALGGGVHIGVGAYVGAGALVREGVLVGDWSLVGMGSVVVDDVPAGETWYGFPARHRGLAPDSALRQWGRADAAGGRAVVRGEGES